MARGPRPVTAAPIWRSSEGAVADRWIELTFSWRLIRRRTRTSTPAWTGRNGRLHSIVLDPPRLHFA
jgi:hypothetical protein